MSIMITKNNTGLNSPYVRYINQQFKKYKPNKDKINNSSDVVCYKLSKEEIEARYGK